MYNGRNYRRWTVRRTPNHAVIVNVTIDHREHTYTLKSLERKEGKSPSRDGLVGEYSSKQELDNAVIEKMREMPGILSPAELRRRRIQGAQIKCVTLPTRRRGNTDVNEAAQ